MSGHSKWHKDLISLKIHLKRRVKSAAHGISCRHVFSPSYFWTLPNLGCSIDPSTGVWLAGDLTNYNAETTIFSDKQTRQESRLMSVDLNNGVYWCLFTVETRYLLMIIHVYFVLQLVKMKRWSVHVPLELRNYSNLSGHIKEPQNSICWLNL